MEVQDWFSLAFFRPKNYFVLLPTIKRFSSQVPNIFFFDFNKNLKIILYYCQQYKGFPLKFPIFPFDFNKNLEFIDDFF